MAALEQDQGEVPLHASALRLGLTGSRGAVTCFLWMTAIDKQKRHEWNELEVLVDSLTYLQPHFITPWLFQSWNLSYNVSAECDRVNDKYFYIARGVNLQAHGERQNRDNPTMRYWIGFYTHHKINQSDETNVHRSLLELSNIPPNERDPARFYVVDAQGKKSVDVKPGSEFEKFCKAHPQLVRRLQMGIPRDTRSEDRHQFKCATPEAVVLFLAENRRVPSLFVDPPPEPLGSWQQKPDKLKPVYDRFPALPPPVETPSPTNPRPARPTLPLGADPAHWSTVPFELGDLTAADAPLKDHQDANLIGRAWYGYAVEPVPPPDPDVPGESMPVVDRVRQRLPKYMAAILFRQQPARAQSYAAERLQQEGWFDDEGWEVPNWFGDRKVVIGTDPGQMSQAAWREAYLMWQRHGVANHLMFPSPTAETITRDKAADFRKALEAGTVKQGMPIPPALLPASVAFRVIAQYESSRTMSNFGHHFSRALVEQEPDTVTARKLFHRADELRLTADLGEALAIYEGNPDEKQSGAIQRWKKVLLAEGHKDFRSDDLTQEETYEVERKYLELVNEQLKLRLTRLQPLVPLVPKTSADVFTDWILNKGPFDINVDDEGKEVPADKGQPLISDATRKAVQGRHVQPGKSQGPPKQLPPPQPPGSPTT
jgi:hypothetical protein